MQKGSPPELDYVPPAASHAVVPDSTTPPGAVSGAMMGLPRRKAAINRSTRALVRSFGHAFAGVWYLFRTQRNAQIHLLITACAVALGAFLGLARWEWLSLVLVIALVLAAEGVNTAVEAAVDLTTTSYHPLARIAKDVAAGAVVLCALAAVLVGCIVFLPHLLPLLAGWFAGS